MEVSRRDNNPYKKPIYARIFDHKLQNETRRAFLHAVQHMHDVEGLTWSGVAEVVGIGLTTLQDIRIERRHVSLPSLYFVAEHLGLSMVELLSLGQE